MGDDLLELYIRQVIEAQRSPLVTINWQGGEPTLMGLDFFKRAMVLVDEYRPRGMHVEHTFQTNGLKVDDAWCDFFLEHDVLVGLSIDGPREMHDAFRVDKAGRGTFDQVVAAAERFRTRGVKYNILCSVHARNVDRPLEVYRFFRDTLDARFIQFIPIVERATKDTVDLANRGWSHGRRTLYTQSGALVTERSVAPKSWGAFLIAVFDEWVHHDVGQVFVPMFEAALASWLGLPPSMCIFAETCGDALALEHNGDLYSCDHFVEPDHRLGNIRKTHMLELVASPQQRAFGQAKKETLPAYCRRCDVRFACNGECPRNRFATTPDGEPGLNYLCEGYRAFFRHIDLPMRTLVSLIRQGRAPDEIMHLPMSDGSPLPNTRPPSGGHCRSEET